MNKPELLPEEVEIQVRGDFEKAAREMLKLTDSDEPLFTALPWVELDRIYNIWLAARDYYTRTPDAPQDVILFCPECRGQHIDANPSCEVCGHLQLDHRDKGYDADVAGSIPGLGSCAEDECECQAFKLWENRPHKRHRCHHCGTIWKAANISTNGVETLGEKPDAK